MNLVIGDQGMSVIQESTVSLCNSHLLCVLQNPSIADIYTEHPHQVIVAKYAPSGFYIASGGEQFYFVCMRVCVREREWKGWWQVVNIL